MMVPMALQSDLRLPGRASGSHSVRRLRAQRTAGTRKRAGPDTPLPLDGHLEVGDNALLAQAIGAAEMEPFAAHRRAIVGVRAGRCHTRA